MNTKLEVLIYQINKENIDEQSDEINKMNMIYEKDYNKIYKIVENKEETSNIDI